MKTKIMMLAYTILAVTLLALVSSCSSRVVEQGAITNLDAQGFRSLIQGNSEVYVIDVHIPEQQHIIGTDAFIPYDALKDNIDKLPKDKDAPVAVYCRSGHMSDTASKVLADMGYTNIYNLEGGANAWRDAGFGFI